MILETKGERSSKYVKADGREAVFDGDTKQPMKDARYIATYNYVTPYTLPKANRSAKDYVLYAGTRAGHFLADVAPYYLTGKSNTRKQFDNKLNKIFN